MKNRNPLAVFFLPFITLGIYSLVWFVSTKTEMNQKGADIPTAWLIIIPFADLYWLWKYSKGVDHVTNSKMGTGEALALLLLLGPIGTAIVQSSFNKVGQVVRASAAQPA